MNKFSKTKILKTKLMLEGKHVIYAEQRDN
jgi:hypothetical protein